MFKRSLIFILVLICIPTVAFAVGFTSDVSGINEAAKSVLMLEVYQDDVAIGTGSGFVVENNRTLITNYHVMEGADMIVGYSDDGYSYIINKVYAVDEERDLAVLGFFSPTNLTPLKLNTGDILRAEPVVAIGSPKGMLNTVSMGNVSAVFTDEDIDYVQFTAPISNGSSGGALFNDKGDVIGVTTMAIAQDGDVVQNLNFAVNATEILKLLGTVNESNAISLEDYCAGAKPGETPAPTPIPTPTPAPTLNPTDGIHDVQMVYNGDGTATFSWYDDHASGENTYGVTLFNRHSGQKNSFEVVVTVGENGYAEKTIKSQYYFGAKYYIGVARSKEASDSIFRISQKAYATSIPYIGRYTLTPSPEDYSQYIALKVGDKGDAVKNLQHALINKFYLTGTADGIYGKKTAAAVKLFCNCHDIQYSDEASPLMQLYLLEGYPGKIRYDDIVLDVEYAEWYYLSNDRIKIRFRVRNTSDCIDVSKFSLGIFGLSQDDKTIDSDYLTIEKLISAGKTVYTDYVILDDRSYFYSIKTAIENNIYKNDLLYGGGYGNAGDCTFFYID